MVDPGRDHSLGGVHRGGKTAAHNNRARAARYRGYREGLRGGSDRPGAGDYDDILLLVGLVTKDRAPVDVDALPRYVARVLGRQKSHHLRDVLGGHRPSQDQLRLVDLVMRL